MFPYPFICNLLFLLNVPIEGKDTCASPRLCTNIVVSYKLLYCLPYIGYLFTMASTLFPTLRPKKLSFTIRFALVRCACRFVDALFFCTNCFIAGSSGVCELCMASGSSLSLSVTISPLYTLTSLRLLELSL